MRTAAQVLGKNKEMTVNDLMKILKRVSGDAKITVPSHCSAGYYAIDTTQVSFDGESIRIGT